MKRALACVAVVAAAALAPGEATAHPRLVETSPAVGATLSESPAAVVVRLSEPAEPVGEAISVTGPDGQEVGRGPVRVREGTLTRSIDARQEGTYVVEWLVVGSDSHPARGAFLFSVGEPTRSELPGKLGESVVLQALGRWLSLLGFALGFGVPFAALLSGGMTPRLWRLVSAGVALMLVAEPVALLGQTASLSPSRMFEPDLLQAVLQTRYGHDAALRLGAALGLWALAGGLRHASPRAQWTIPAAGAAVAIVLARSMHTLAGVPSFFGTVVSSTHVLAFGAWLGCILVALAEHRGRRLARAAVLAVLGLVLSGSALALAQLDGLSDLVETAYGTTLGVKLALVAVTLALGAAARRRAELAAALVVLAAASLLVTLVPPP